MTAVYSGTFDPLHVGHLAILRALCGSPEYDRVLLVVSPQNPFKDETHLVTADARLEAAREAVARHPELEKVEVSDIEFTLPAPQYTIRTLDELSRRNPGESFRLVMGADNLERITGWRDYRRILSEYGVAVYPRPGFDLSAAAGLVRAEMALEGLDCRIEIIDAPMVEISSTMIRKAESKGEDVSAFLI